MYPTIQLEHEARAVESDESPESLQFCPLEEFLKLSTEKTREVLCRVHRTEKEREKSTESH
jgi:hypothetical protein